MCFAVWGNWGPILALRLTTLLFASAVSSIEYVQHHLLCVVVLRIKWENAPWQAYHRHSTNVTTTFTTATIFGVWHLRDPYLRDFHLDHRAFAFLFKMWPLSWKLYHTCQHCLSEGHCLSGRTYPICAYASGLTMNKNHKQVVPGNQVWLSFHHVTGTAEIGLETGSQSTSAGQR